MDHHFYLKDKLRDHTEDKPVAAKGEKGREGRSGNLINKLPYIELINSKVPLSSTRNYIQYPVINHNGKNMKKSSIYAVICVNIYRALSHFAVQK